MLQGERRAGPAQPRREHVGVNDDPAGQLSFSAARNASHSSAQLRDRKVVNRRDHGHTHHQLVERARPAEPGVRLIDLFPFVGSVPPSVLLLGQIYDRVRRPHKSPQRSPQTQEFSENRAELRAPDRTENAWK
jgi:hypothetical protein